MLPSRARARVLEQHRTLCAQAERVRDLAGEPIANRDELAGLEAELAALDRLVCAQIALEDRLLTKALCQADAFGDVWARRLAEHHDRQLAYVRSCLARLSDARLGPLVVAHIVRVTMGDLRADLAEQERTLFDPGLLRDDTVTISPSA